MTDDYDENITLSCPNCGGSGMRGLVHFGPDKRHTVTSVYRISRRVCSAECVCEYLGIPFYNDDEVPKELYND